MGVFLSNASTGVEIGGIISIYQNKDTSVRNARYAKGDKLGGRG